MHFESHGIATGDPKHPFVARITFGTKNRRETKEEFEAPSLADAQRQADDWLNEYCARIGLGDATLLKPSAMRARWARLHDGMPKFPEPGKAYCAALERMGEEQEDDEAVEEVEIAPQTVRSRRGASYPHRAKIVSAVASARAADIDVAGIRVWPDGSIAVFDERALEVGRPTSENTPAASEYEQWKQRRAKRR